MATRRFAQAVYDAHGSSRHQVLKVFGAVTCVAALATWRVVSASSSKRGQSVVSQDKPETGPDRNLAEERAKVEAWKKAGPVSAPVAVNDGS
jgi:hypothetical protein